VGTLHGILFTGSGREGDTVVSMDEKQVVRNIRTIRQSRKITLEQLAKLTGLTKGYISRIENSRKAPPLSTLYKIAIALDTDLSVLFSEKLEVPEKVRLCIVRKNERKEVVTQGTLYGYQYVSLAYKKPGKNMEPYIIEPAVEEVGIFSHEGEEFMFVLEGTHEFVYENEKYVLNEGDSAYFDSAIPHSGRSIGEKKARILGIMYSYKR
jgi:transcriptional regulator with XRE-family HTH domain